MPPRDVDFDENRSVWVQGCPDAEPEAPLRGEVKADVVIVGGGFTGMSTAYNLSERFPDRRIVLLEARRVANGASGRSGGQMLHWINGVGYEDPELVRAVYAATDRGIRFITDTIARHGLAVRHALNGSFELVTNAGRVEESRAHVARLREWGVPLEWKDAAQTRELLALDGVQGGIFDPGTGMVNGADFLRALKPVLLGRGVVIHEDTMVTRIEEGATHRVCTREGSVTAPALVLATNAYTPKLGYFGDRVFPLLSHMVATDPLEPGVAGAVGWRPGLPFCDDLDRIAYGGVSPDGRLLFGGGSNASYTYGFGGPTAVPVEQHEASFDAVRRRLTGYVPALAGRPLPLAWSGPLAITMNRQCTMGVRGQHKNVYFALGYSGHGVALANLAGIVLTDLYSDHHEPWRGLPFYQNPLYWIPPEPLRWTGYQIVTGLTGKSPRRR